MAKPNDKELEDRVDAILDTVRSSRFREERKRAWLRALIRNVYQEGVQETRDSDWLRTLIRYVYQEGVEDTLQQI
jgi:hypothetical protein